MGLEDHCKRRWSLIIRIDGDFLFICDVLVWIYDASRSEFFSLDPPIEQLLPCGFGGRSQVQDCLILAIARFFESL